MKKLIIFIVCACVFAVGFIYSKSTVKGLEGQKSSLEAQLVNLNNEYSAKLSSQTAENEKIIERATGLVQERKDIDDSKMTTYVSEHAVDFGNMIPTDVKANAGTLQFTDFTSYVMNFSGDTYNYFAVVRATDSSGTVVANVIVTYTVEKSGSISNLKNVL